MTSQSTSDPTKIRYHGLDALRDWAMSLGLVLHAAWIMVPVRPSWIGWMLNGRMESVWRRDHPRQVEKDIRITNTPVASAPDVACPLERIPMTNIERVPACPKTREVHE